MKSDRAQSRTNRKDAVMHARLLREARTDPLTGLMNRRWLDEFLVRRPPSARRRPTGTAIILADVDGLQAVNRRFGYSVGDRALAGAARRMAAAAGPDRTVVRFGGDEFVIPCEGLRPAEVKALALRVIRAASGRNLRDSTASHPPVAVSASAGVALRKSGSWDRGMTPLLDAAGRALQRAKSAGGRCVRWSWA
jgi:diguanylate cyclase (GGDEF)-like protein